MPAKYPPVALPDHPFAAGLQAYCLGFDGAYEDYPWGEVVYKVNEKLFATLNRVEAGLTMTVKSTQDEAEGLTLLPHIVRAPYIGRYGWVQVRITDEGSLDHARELVAASYALVAPKKRRAKTT